MPILHKKILGLACLVMMTGSGAGAIVTIANPGLPVEIGARARNGGTAAEVQLLDRVPALSVVANRNATGTPVWTYGHSYPFSATYSGATGQLTFSVDFNKSGIAGDLATGGLRETITYVYPEFIGSGFTAMSLTAQGRNSPAVSMTLSNLILNGTPLSNLSSSGNTAATNYYASSTPGEIFANISLTGQMIFSGDGTVIGRPQMEFGLAGAVPLGGPIPEPSRMVLLGLAGLLLTGRRSRAKIPGLA